MKINVIGLGPGHPDYMTPAAVSALNKSDIIIAGKRNLESIDTAGKETIEITGNLTILADHIRQKYHTKQISVAASGDPGFYGILGFMKRNFDDSDLTVIPGVSSMQYLSAKLNMEWEDAYLGSIHGREDDIASAVKLHAKSVFLTDLKNSYSHIACLLCDAGFGHCKMILGINLSYPDERIIKFAARDAALMREIYDLCTVVILNEK